MSRDVARAEGACDWADRATMHPIAAADPKRACAAQRRCGS